MKRRLYLSPSSTLSLEKRNCTIIPLEKKEGKGEEGRKRPCGRVLRLFFSCVFFV